MPTARSTRSNRLLQRLPESGRKGGYTRLSPQPYRVGPTAHQPCYPFPPPESPLNSNARACCGGAVSDIAPVEYSRNDTPKLTSFSIPLQSPSKYSTARYIYRVSVAELPALQRQHTLYEAPASMLQQRETRALHCWGEDLRSMVLVGDWRLAGGAGVLAGCVCT